MLLVVIIGDTTALWQQHSPGLIRPIPVTSIAIVVEQAHLPTNGPADRTSRLRHLVLRFEDAVDPQLGGPVDLPQRLGRNSAR